MKNSKINYLKNAFLLVLVLLTNINCERDLSEDATLSTFSKTGEIFTDSPVGMGSNFYFPYGGSKATAWSVDNEVSYKGTSSMRFDIPNANDPEGNYAGAIFRIDGAGRDLTGYDALTFWAKSSQGVNIAEFGFGEDFFPNKYIATITNVSVGTIWTKYIIPIPDASKLLEERGMFRYAAGTQETGGFGYTLWIDELKFEKLNTIGQLRPKILNGNTQSITSVIGGSTTLNGYSATFNLPTGQDVTVISSPSYFNFSSSATSVATVNETGTVSVVGSGNAAITATLAGVEAVGVLNVESIGAFVSAPTPTENANQVISIFSDAYTNQPVDFLTSNYQPYQTTTSSHFEVNGDNVLNYLNYNFVGIEFNQNVPTINASLMSTLHFDLFIPGNFPTGSSIRLKLRNLGANGLVDNDFNGNPTGDDTEISYVVAAPALVSGNWISIDFNITGLTNRTQLGQIVLDSVTGVAPSAFFVDNIYFYNDGSIIPSSPTVAAPSPTVPAVNVISLFSNQYTNVPVDTWKTSWSVATFADVIIAGNATKEYSNLDFVGIETVNNQIDASGMTHVHIDVWSPNFTSFSLKLVDFGANAAFGGGDDTEHQVNFTAPSQGQWISYDIPLSNFTGLTSKQHLAQYILVAQPSGSAKVYIDNLYFHN
ncbi:Ig-like domain-containing protein [uncultured Flavobacterium sp.]|uniref:Ig-like domain-containing protein n=1 Tax=uncultured Flavobacterium sp. TaxID=165435 RepID=UPI0030ED0770